MRSPITADQVKVYLEPPTKYEQVALLESSSQTSWSITAQGKMEVVIERLKAEAAKIGANGMLLRSTGNEYGGSVGSGVGTARVSGGTAFGTGFGTTVGIMHKAGSAIAIFVDENQ